MIGWAVVIGYTRQSSAIRTPMRALLLMTLCGSTSSFYGIQVRYWVQVTIKLSYLYGGCLWVPTLLIAWFTQRLSLMIGWAIVQGAPKHQVLGSYYNVNVYVGIVGQHLLPWQKHPPWPLGVKPPIILSRIRNKVKWLTRRLCRCLLSRTLVWGPQAFHKFGFETESGKPR